jgi:outer membrane protein assembly factor BamB
MLLTTGFAGEVFAWDVNNGNLIWRYNVTDPYNQIKEGLSNYPVLFDFYTEDGRLYLVQMEHSPTTPLARNAPYICLNATTGEVIWKIDGLKGVRWGGPNVIGDGIIGFFNAYDNRIYAIGKGRPPQRYSARHKHTFEFLI